MKLPWITALCIVLLTACASIQAVPPTKAVPPADVAVTTSSLSARVSATPSASAVASPSGVPLPSSTASPANGSVPRLDHVVVLIFENRPYSQIIGNSCCPYLNQQASVSALMTQSFGVTHPSQPNYLDLFSGAAQGVMDDTCPAPGSPYATPNLGQQLIDAGLSFAGYSEDLPTAGSLTCSTDSYARKHSPWADFSNVPSADNRPFTSFPSDFTTLPTVSFISPNLCHDMHNCAASSGDDWLRSHLDAFIQWAPAHHSLLIVTFDEDDYDATNRVVTFFEGALVQPGAYRERITHYNVLRTLEAMYSLPYAGQAAHVATITDIWQTPTPPAP